MLMLLSIISWGNDTCNEMISLVEVKLVIPSLKRLSGALIPGWRMEDECFAMSVTLVLIVGESYREMKVKVFTGVGGRRLEKDR